jgi:hypothetical protein
MIIRAAHKKLSNMEVKIDENKKICDLILSDPETSDYSLLDQSVDALLVESAVLVAECERELEEFNNKYPAVLSNCLEVLKDADAPALMRKKLEEARRTHADSKEVIEKKEVTEEEIKNALNEMQQWDVKRFMQEACSFTYKESALTGGIERDQLAIRVERSAGQMLKSAKSDELIQLRQIYDRRSDLQVFYMSLLKYKSYRKLGKEMPFSVLLPLEMSFRCYKKACGIISSPISRAEEQKTVVQPVPAAREEKQQQKGWFSSLSMSKKVMLGIGAALLVGGITIATAGIGGVALNSAG